MRKASEIYLTEEERHQLESWVRKGTMEQRLVERARIVLEAATGKTSKEIAQSLKTRPATVSKWRTRFSRQGMAGLYDMPRPGKTAKYDQNTERRILTQLDNAPPTGYATWTGELLSQALEDVSPHQVWRVLRRHGIHLQRRRSWCISTDSEFAKKAADIVGLYLDPPENAVVIGVDEKPAIQVLERAQGWLRLPDGQRL
jgi:transposase